ncbi:MAG: DUF4288 domain-containing protein [Clostridiales bacterium]|nr:DUF4288 domain-containing protein [Clostridiales bacterium]
MRKNKKESSWKWYAVNLLFESTISGEPNKELIDENFSNEFKLYEERIVVVHAQSPDHAYKLAEIDVKISEMVYKNPYDQTVHKKLAASINCQELFDSEIKTGTEIYSRLFPEPTDMKVETVIEVHCPEAVDKTPAYNFLINEPWLKN